MRSLILSLMLTVAVTHVHAVSLASFFVKNANAKMPVVVRGNFESRVLIVFLHGGPGGTGIKKMEAKAFMKLQEAYAMVFWDQRGSGLSRGGKQKKYLNLNQYIEDLDVLIDKLKKKYPSHAIILMGHCWGGGYGTAYLIDPNHQAKINGWIEVAGAHNNPMGDSLSMLWVQKYAKRQIERNRHVSYWKRVLRWYSRNPDFSSEQIGHYMFVKKAHGYVHKKTQALGKYPGYNRNDIFRTPLQYAAYFLSYYKTLSKFIISDFDFTNEMRFITIPTLIIWGENDGLIPVPLATNAYNALGTAETDKHLIIYPKTAHTVFYEQPDRFVQSVSQFVQRYACVHVKIDNTNTTSKTLP